MERHGLLYVSGAPLQIIYQTAEVFQGVVYALIQHDHFPVGVEQGVLHLYK